MFTLKSSIMVTSLGKNESDLHFASLALNYQTCLEMIQFSLNTMKAGCEDSKKITSNYLGEKKKKISEGDF